MEQSNSSGQLQMPAPQAGMIPTLNKMGYMTVHLNPYSQRFVDFAPSAPGPVLEVGAAYGNVALAAVELGAKVIANDIEHRHLEILLNRIPNHLRHRVQTMQGSFPNLEIEPSSIGAILVSRLFHFFDGPTIERSAKEMLRWLAPAGKVFVVSETAYLKPFKEFIPIYEERKANGDLWPGWMEDLQSYTPQTRKADVPQSMNLLDCEILTRVFQEAGFLIEATGMFSYEDYPDDLRLDGREGVGLIAIKSPS